MLMAGEFEGARLRARKVLDKSPRNVEAQILFANSLAGLKDLDGAVREVEQAIETDPRRGLSYTNLGALQFARGQRELAEPAFLNAVKLDPASVPAQLALANFYWATERPADAEATLKKVVDLDPKNSVARRALAAFLMGTSRAAEAEPHLKAAADASTGAGLKIVLADYYLAQRKTDEALKVLEATSKLRDGISPALTRIAAIRYEQGRKDEAYRVIGDLLKQLPSDAKGLMIKGRFLMGDGRRDEAVASVQGAIKADPRLPAAHYLMALLSLPGDPQAAIKSLTEVVNLEPRAVPALVQLAQLQLAQGDAKTAVQYASEAAKYDPASPGVHELFARALLANREVGRAEAEVATLMRDSPAIASGPLLAGVIAAAKGDRAGAGRLFEQALKADPTSIEALTGLVQLNVADRKFAQARSLIQARLAKPPSDSRVQLLAAGLARAEGDAATEEKSLRAALESDPANLDAYIGLGRLFASQSRMAEAQKEFEAVAARQPRAIGAMTMAAMAAQVQGRLDEAQKKYEQILVADPRAPIAANNLAVLYSERGGNLDIALQLAQTAKSGLPDRPEISDTLGWLYYRKNQPAMAVGPLQQAVEKDPKNAAYRFHLGLAYAKTGDKTKARETLETALKLDPNHADAAEARKVLGSL